MSAPVAVLFANLKGNVGDFAILEAVLRDLAVRFPEAERHVYAHGFRGIDEARHLAFAARAPYHVLAGRTFAEAQAPRRLETRVMRALGLGRRLQERRTRRLAAASAPDAARFGDYQAIALAGGAHWSGSSVGVSMFGTLRAAAARGAPIHAYPFSVEPSLLRQNAHARLRADFARIRPPLLVRDSLSFETLRQVGAAPVLGADCVFGLAGIGMEMPPMREMNASRILFAVTRQDPEALEGAVRRLQAAGRAPELLTTCEEEDAALMAPLAARCGVPLHAPLTWQEVVAEMRAAALVVTNRLHGLILGSFADVPLVPLADRMKSRAYAQDAAAPVVLPDLGALTADFAAAAEARGAEIRRAVAAFRDRQRQERMSPFGTGAAAG